MKVSVIIRSKNEERTIGKLLEKLSTQSFRDFETILVDNSSTDNTLKIAKKYKIDKIIEIPRDKFSHPKSLNDAIKISSGDLIVITNAHSIPVSNDWLKNGLKHFSDPKIAAITGDYVYADNELNLADRIFLPNANLSNTNSIIRKKLWDSYHFDENLSGCEDYDWGLEMKSKGYKIIKDPGFIVRHYHKITPETRKYWAKMVKQINEKPRRKPLSHRVIYLCQRIRDRLSL